MKSFNLHRYVQASLIAALYCALTFAMYQMSFQSAQLRLSEALCVLPLFTTASIPGLTLGCAMANFIGFMTGANPAGAWDCLIGSGATLLAVISTYYIGKWVKDNVMRCILAPLPAVIFNAVIIGLELTMAFSGGDMSTFVPNMISVGLGQLIVCYALGVPLMLVLQKNNLYKKIFN